MKRLATLLALLTAATGYTQAQFSRYIVQFTDKKGAAYTLSDPAAYLSAKSMARRTRYKISYDSTDLPVSTAYLDSIRSIPNVTIINVSKWLNQVLIKTTDAGALARINAFPFVKKSNGIAPRMATGNSSVSATLASETVTLPASMNQVSGRTGTAAIDYGQMYNQIHIHNGDWLHQLGFTGRGVTIAVLDAGFQNYLSNPAFDSVRLQGRILGTWDYVKNEASVNEDNSHGANVFSLLAANRPGVLVGTAPHASYWLLRTEDVATEYPVEEQNWVVAAEFADSVGVDMISSSLGYNVFDNAIFNYSHAQRDGKTAMITLGANLAAKKGILVVVAAGNSGGEASDLKYVAVPADAENVLTVGSVDINGNIGYSSSWGPNGAGVLKPNVVAVGVNAYVAHPQNWQPVAGTGTSYACPNMAGLTACLWQVFPELSSMQIMDALQKSGSKSANPEFQYGYGIPDMKKAVAILTKQYASAGTAFDNCIVSVNWNSKDDTSSLYTIQRKLPGETGFMTIGQTASTSLSFKANSYTYRDTIKAAGGPIQYRVLQAMRSVDTVLEIANLQQPIHSVCFPDNTLMALPSPFDQQLTVVVNTPEVINNMGLQITDMRGRIVYAKKTAKPAGYFSTTVMVPGWSPGIYEVVLYNNSKRIYSRKVLKK
ncbi:S8 family peptidase [Longitalea luteola]|uniref:S8 family peptidase n=1 Tax=Longitalea luteola TaxID=2812563 RepID=UPI001A95EBAA|nr:S8 family peptidase [Longitalea luteola]